MERFPEVELAPVALLERDDGSGEQICVHVPPNRLLGVTRFLIEDDRLDMQQLCDLTCIDYLNFPRAPDRYGVIYSLLSIRQNHRLWVKCMLNDPHPEVPSVVSLWYAAEWLEREVFDMFGIVFTDHPDLRRILTWDGFEAHPLRKDYPLRGRGEREDYAVVTRDSA